MTTPLYGAAPTTLLSATPLSAHTPSPRPALPPTIARATLLSAALLGATADALMHDGPSGVGLVCWIALLGLNAVVLSTRAGRTVSRQTLAWLAAAVVFSVGLMWRNSGALQGFDFLAMLFALGMAAVSVRDPEAALFARRLRHTAFTAFDVGVSTLVGVLPLAFRDAVLNETSKNALGRARMLLRPALIAVAALVIFGSLLRNADPIFASLVDLSAFDFETVGSHVIVAGFFAWIVAGWARGSLAENPATHRSLAPLPIQLDTADITAALGTLSVLFAAFVATQIGWMFGGEKFLQARTGLTAAAYARQGFFQMVWVVTLVVPILVGSRAALAPGRALARRHTLLSLPVVVLLGAIIVSAMLRMKMYVHYYGLTTERVYPTVFMLWLATVIVWLTVTVLRDWARPFIGGAVISGLAFLIGLNLADPDAIVARVNVARAERIDSPTQSTLDLMHLTTLSGKGTSIAVDAILHSDVSYSVATTPNTPAAQRCLAARLLLSRWNPQSQARRRTTGSGGWRYWNHDDAIAFSTVDAHRTDLQRFANEGCAPPQPSH
jgi:hypothetical protein